MFNEKQQLTSHVLVAKRAHSREGLGMVLFMKMVLPKAEVENCYLTLAEQMVHFPVAN